MWSLLLQSLVLLLAAYFIGVWIGCMARRLIAPPRSRSSASAQAPVETSNTEQAKAAESSPAPSVAAVAAAGTAAAATAVAGQTTASSASEAPIVEPPSASTPSVADRMETIGTSVDPVAARSHIKPEPFPEGRLPAASGGGGEAESSVAAVVAHPATPPKEKPPAQDLTAIRGIDAATSVVLAREGVTRYEQLSAWNEGDVARINRALGGMRRVQEENWIEQAKILATGGMTAFARRRKSNAAAGAPAAPQLVSPSPDQGNVVNLATYTTAAASAGSTTAGETNADPSGVAADVSGDDLEQINGITPEISRLLREQGITRYAQLARLDDAGANRLNGLLGIEQRVQREQWREQAAAFSGQSSSSDRAIISASEMAASAIAATVVSSSTVPVQSVGADVMQPANSNASDAVDNLRRIRGIGELIERKLYGLGFTSYAAIADWTEQDVRQVSEVLDFRGRIERENWIEQARILASGGQTEFSRRFDTGG